VNQEKTPPLLIGYGNTLRGDDGLGPYVASAVAKRFGDAVTVWRGQQLTPELAALIAQSETVIFIDATMIREEGGCQFLPLERKNPANWGTHLSSPTALLALAEELYNAKPQAWCLTVPGTNFDLGEGFSPLAQENARQAIGIIKKVLQLH
jgi:hydrogenase maturation protease